MYPKWRDLQMDAALELIGVTGGYSPRRPVLHEVTFTVGEAEMVGLIGLNGAGKSTTIKHILGLMTPFAGEIRLFGRTLEEAPEQYRAAYAYVPETPLLYEELTVREHLRLTAMAYGLDEAVYRARSGQLLERFQMDRHADRLPMHLSKGMRQKVMIMCAFLVEPKLYIIDEPFLGLDPLGIRSLLDLLVERRAEGASILMSSHILSTIERYCDRFHVLHHGRLRATGTLEELRRLTGQERLEDMFCSLVTKDGEG
jgi:ABC-2 type transport system ATP-binding protein